MPWLPLLKAVLSFFMLLHFQFISLSLAQWKNMKTILNFKFFTGIYGCCCCILLILQSRYNKRTTTPNTVSKVVLVCCCCWFWFCYSSPTTDSSLHQKYVQHNKSTQFKIHAVYYHLYVNFGRLLLKLKKL